MTDTKEMLDHGDARRIYEERHPGMEREAHAASVDGYGFRQSLHRILGLEAHGGYDVSAICLDTSDAAYFFMALRLPQLLTERISATLVYSKHGTRGEISRGPHDPIKEQIRSELVKVVAGPLRRLISSDPSDETCQRVADAAISTWYEGLVRLNVGRIHDLTRWECSGPHFSSD